MSNKGTMYKSYQAASSDIQPELDKLRKEKPTEYLYNYYTDETSCDVYVVGMSRVNTKETRMLNVELGLTTVDGINQWYKAS